LHVLYGLIQDEDLRARMTRAGADVERMEKRMLDDLERVEVLPPGTAMDMSLDARRALNWAATLGYSQERDGSCTDMLGALIRRAPEVDAVFATGGVRALDLLVELIHGPTSRRAPETPHLAVVLVNDNFTTMEFVVEILEKVFELDKEEATRSM